MRLKRIQPHFGDPVTTDVVRRLSTEEKLVSSWEQLDWLEAEIALQKSALVSRKDEPTAFDGPYASISLRSRPPLTPWK